jgi:hypothetical protein
MYGVVTELGHIQDSDTVVLETSEPTEDDPIEWVSINVRSASTPAFAETRTVDEEADNTPGPMETTREMTPREQTYVETDDEYEDWTVDELKEELGNRSLPVSGKKAELVQRLNAADEGA